MKVLVTGGAGFIGSHLAGALVERGDTVTVFDSLTTGKLENLREIRDHLRFVRGDVRDRSALDQVMQGIDVVFHEAAIVSVPYSVEHPEESHATNLLGTLQVLESARTAGVRRVVFASSAAVYGEEPTLPKVESMLPAPVSPYGVEKLAGEHYLGAWAKLHAMETVPLRYFNVFGPRQDPASPYSGVISVFMKRAAERKPVTVFGDGLQTRDFVFVEDVVQANLLAGSAAPGRSLVSGAAINVARGEETTLLSLAAAIGDVTGRPLEVLHEPPRPGDIRFSRAAIDRAREALGYAPAVGIREGLTKLWNSLHP